jgi:uncharacterized protein (TIGR02246 family)
MNRSKYFAGQAMLSLILVLTTFAAASAANAHVPLSAVRQAINSGNARFLKSLEAGDAKAFAALFAPDGIELESGDAGVTKGRAAIEAAEAASAKDSKITGGSIHTTNVYLDGGIAYETGTYNFDIALPGKPARTATGRYFEVWEKQPDGAWLIKVDCGYPDKYKR